MLDARRFRNIKAFGIFADKIRNFSIKDNNNNEIFTP